jgi:hypothetical protein
LAGLAQSFVFALICAGFVSSCSGFGLLSLLRSSGPFAAIVSGWGTAMEPTETGLRHLPSSVSNGDDDQPTAGFILTV